MRNGYIAVLEMRKKRVGFFMHCIHLLLTLLTGLWVIVWVGHAVSVSNHNKSIDRQIQRLIDADVLDALDSRL
jgi:hydrogenase maturation factor